MNNERLSYLLKQYLENKLGKEEQEELDRLLQQGGETGQMASVLEDLIGQEQGISAYQQEDWEGLFQKIKVKTVRPARVRRMVQKRLMAAAALVLLSVSGWLLYTRHTGDAVAGSSPVQPHPDIIPGGNKATLTLADNRTINLDDMKDGVVGKQGNSELIKQKDGQLTYRAAGQQASVISYNLLTTPRGGQYQLLLPDGSKVWLNAASSLRYPTSFAGKERVVELQGEAYFEIAHNPAMPFRVAVAPRKGQEPADVEVLGTHFSIKAYADEPDIQATLLEGSVRVHKGGNIVPLQPGQQASWNTTKEIRVAPADVEEAIAWKNGLFKFKEATIEDVMRQLSRWYDVEVVYTNGIPRDLFQGEIYRNVNVSKVLKILEASGVHVTVEGKKILVQ